VTTPCILEEPYPGLRSFRRDETHIFFGRETCISDMVYRLAAHRFLAVTGASGSGKSSLVRTGLLDALDRGLLAAAGADWRVADFRPGGRPLTEIATALIKAVGTPTLEHESARTEATLARGPLGLYEWLTTTNLSPRTNLLVLADQFEEIFRFRRGQAGDEVNAFVALLLESARQRGRPIYVVITMRSDFLGECAQFRGLAEAINDGQYLTPRLTREQCQSAIEGPAAVFGGRVERALLNRLLNDMGTHADQLPLAQHVLMRLWRIASTRADGDGCVLTLEDYEKLGGLGAPPTADRAGESGQLNALSAHADEILAELTKGQQQLAETLFRALTESRGLGGHDVRRPVALAEAAAIAGAPAGELILVVDAFRAAGRNLLGPPLNVPIGPDTVVDISHESLIRQWGTLRQWMRDEYDAARTYLHVETTAKLWRDGQAGLMTMPYLSRARVWREREAPKAAWAKRYGEAFDLAMDFLDQSLAAERRRVESEVRAKSWRARRQLLNLVAVIFFLFAVLATGAGVLAYRAGQEEAVKEADAAMAIALYAYTADDIPLLQATSQASYIVGYRIFKDGRLAKAIPFFKQAILERRFVASSYFLLGYIASHDKEGHLVNNSSEKDWSQAERLLDKAIAANPSYAPAYYIRASLYANSNRIQAALKNLPKAVLPLKFGRINCQNINNPESIEKEWKPLVGNAEFHNLQERCRRVHGI
jgi:tetratricopeptide (TPR) repeat protein